MIGQGETKGKSHHPWEPNQTRVYCWIRQKENR